MPPENNKGIENTVNEINRAIENTLETHGVALISDGERKEHISIPNVLPASVQYLIKPILERFYISSRADLLTEIEGMIPAEGNEYTPPTFTSAKRMKSEEYVKGFNECRSEIISKIQSLKDKENQ